MATGVRGWGGGGGDERERVGWGGWGDERERVGWSGWGGRGGGEGRGRGCKRREWEEIRQETENRRRGGGERGGEGVGLTRKVLPRKVCIFSDIGHQKENT